jgi:O-antigen ligase
MKRININSELVALACGILGVVTAVWVYWLILPGVVLGAVAVVLGWRSRRNGSREGGSVAIALGIAAILLVPSVLVMANEAEGWGRDCALDPTHDPNC